MNQAQAMTANMSEEQLQNMQQIAQSMMSGAGGGGGGAGAAAGAGGMADMQKSMAAMNPGGGMPDSDTMASMSAEMMKNPEQMKGMMDMVKNMDPDMMSKYEPLCADAGGGGAAEKAAAMLCYHFYCSWILPEHLLTAVAA